MTSFEMANSALCRELGFRTPESAARAAAGLRAALRSLAGLRATGSMWKAVSELSMGDIADPEATFCAMLKAAASEDEA